MATINVDKLRPQVYALGRLYRALEDIIGRPSPQKRSLACCRPMYYATMMTLGAHRARRVNDQVANVIATLYDKIIVEDWEEIMMEHMPLELQGVWMTGYYKGMEGIKIKSRLAVARKEKGLTQVQLAEIVGVEQKDISRWETSGNRPNAASRKKLADVLGVDEDML